MGKPAGQAQADLIVIGGGLAGSEAAWQAARRGFRVLLYEMRPEKMTPAHKTGFLAELVCSNSLRAEGLENAVGVLKEEMRILGSLIMECAGKTRVPAGGALAVNREEFSRLVTERIECNNNIMLMREEVEEIPAGVPVIISTGPLTSDSLASGILRLTGERYLYFYDAIAPIVTCESIDFSKTFWASRYGKGGDDYLNCPMSKDEYHRFWEALVNAETVTLHPFEKDKYFEGCMPVEEMARRGPETLTFGPLKPIGLGIDEIDGIDGVKEGPYAVVQLRRENKEGTLFNLVGFQTHLKWGEQDRVFRMIPGLEGAEFVRYGVMHRNTFINSPKLVHPTLQYRGKEDLFFAGQITGVEGYVESTSSGLVAGINAARVARGRSPLVFPPETAHGALCQYITSALPDDFQPMNVNFDLFPALASRTPKKERKRILAQRALSKMKKFQEILMDDLVDRF